MRSPAMLAGAVLLVDGSNRLRCGPTDHEVAAAVLLASPLALAACLALMWLWWHWYQRFDPAFRMDWRRALTIWGASVAVALLAALTFGRSAQVDAWTWLPYAVAVYGPSCLTATMLAFWWGRPRFGADPYSWAAGCGVAVASAPALLLLLTAGPGDAAYHEAYLAIWLVSGGLGLVPIAVLLFSAFWLWRLCKQRGGECKQRAGED